MNRVFALIGLMTMMSAFGAIAQDDDVTADEDPSTLDLFDDDEEFTELGWSRFYANFGATYLDADGSLSVDLPNGESVTIIDFDRVGLKETDSSYWLSFNWRSANSRWGAWFGSWQYDVTGGLQWEDDLLIPGKNPIPAGAYVTSKFDARWYIVEATYSFYRSEAVDAGVGFGVHTVDLDTTLTARIDVGDMSSEIVSERLDTLAPLPNLLAYAYWKFAPRWSLVSRAGWFGLDYKEHSGKMINAHVMLNYDLSSRWSLGGGFQFLDLDLKTEEKNYVKDYSISFSGPLAFLRFDF